VSTPRLVLLPGLDGTGDLLDPFIEALPAGMPTTVVRYTSPPLARYAECRAAAIQHLPRDESFVLVGESFSGPVAVAIAAAQPRGLVGLVLVGSFVSSPTRLITWCWPYMQIVPMEGKVGRIGEFILMGKFATPDVSRRLAAALVQSSPATATARLQAIASCDVSKELTQVRVPVLYVRATHDRLVPRACGERIARLSDRVRIVDIEAPHLLLQCKPRECAAAIADFANETARGVAGRAEDQMRGHSP
jgi:pimeloyl-[acyl-carrier protein] methyl ester esterase